MKIVYERKNPFVTFDTLRQGCVFDYKENLYMKLFYIYQAKNIHLLSDDQGIIRYNAVHLESGKLMSFDDKALTIPLNVELIIK